MQDSLEDFIKLTRNVKHEETHNISKEMQITAQFKKECDARALKIVEFSMEGKLRPEVLTKCLPLITQDQYQDIVEERAITKLCGYPLCGKRIPDMPKKQYMISTKSNKIYDITERKNFCSNFCYKASLHIKKQVDTSPLWLRRLEDIPEYNFLHASDSGLPGEYVEQGLIRPVSVEQTFTPISSFTEVGLNDLIDREIKSGKLNRDRPKSFKKSKLQNTMQTIKENEVIEEQNKANKEHNKSSNKKKEVKESVKNEAAKKDVLKKNVVINLPAIQENEEQKENNLEGKTNEENNKKQIELRENININNNLLNQDSKKSVEDGTQSKSIEDEILKAIDFINKINEIIPKKPGELNSRNKDFINDIKSIENNEIIKNKIVLENLDPIFQKKDVIARSIEINKEKSEKKVNESKKAVSTLNNDKKLEQIIKNIKGKAAEKKITHLKDDKNLKDKPYSNTQDSKTFKTKSESKLDIATVLKQSLYSWLTLDALIFIHGEAKVKEILNENRLSNYFEELNVIEMQRGQQMKYMEICRRLQFQEMADEKFDKGVTGKTKLQPLPDYKHLKKEARDLKLKVKSFFQGEMYEAEDKNFPTKNNKQEEAEEGSPAVLPPVDVSNQNLMRRKIFLGSLNKAMHQLLHSLGISYYSIVLSDLQGLVKTFSLRADNITFKPALWNYIALVLLHMLAQRDINIKNEIDDPRAQEYICTLCDEFPNKKQFIGDILSEIDDIESFVQNYIRKVHSE